MRELSHQISVCVAAWPGGQQDGWEQPLAADTLWTHREGRRVGEGGKEGGTGVEMRWSGVWREREKWRWTEQRSARLPRHPEPGELNGGEGGVVDGGGRC